GDLQGKPTSECLPKIKKYMENPSQPVEGGGESFNQFKNRALGGIERIMKTYPGPIALVTHHRVERLLNAWLATGQTNPKIDIKTLESKGDPPGTAEPFKLTHYPLSCQPIGTRPMNGGVLTAQPHLHVIKVPAKFAHHPVRHEYLAGWARGFLKKHQ